MPNRKLRRATKSKKRGSFKGARVNGKSRTTNADYLRWYNA